MRDDGEFLRRGLDGLCGHGVLVVGGKRVVWWNQGMKTEAGWYAVDMNFGFYRFRDADGVVKTGAQCAMVCAVFERRIVELERFRLSKEPSALDAETIFGLLDGIFSNFGKPDVGIMFMPGVWMATGDLEKRTVSRKRVRA